MYSINWNIAPKKWQSFCKWHKAACKNDPLSAKKRFLKEGGIIPKRNGRKSDSHTKKKE